MKKIKLESFFKFIDYFGQPVQITFEKQKKFKTNFGGFLSLIIYSLIISLIVTNGLNLLNRKNAKTSATNLHQITAPLLNFSDLNSIFVSHFYTNQFQPFLDPSYFDIEVSQFLLKVDANGNSDLSYIPLERVNCSIYLDYFKRNDFEKDYTQNNMLHGVCFDNQKYKELVIGGKFGTEYYSNLLYRLVKCKNTTKGEEQPSKDKHPVNSNAKGFVNNNANFSNESLVNNLNNNSTNGSMSINKQNIVCKSQGEIDAKIKGGYFELFFFDKNINLNDFNNPLNDYLSNYFILLDPKTKKFVDLYFNTVFLTSDSGLIFEDTVSSQNVMFDYFREQIELAIDSDVVIDLYINSSNNILIYNRSYVKFQEFAASIGGLMQILIIFGSVFVHFFNDHRMNERMINSLFTVKEDFDEDGKFYRGSANNNHTAKLNLGKIYKKGFRFTVLRQKDSDKRSKDKITNFNNSNKNIKEAKNDSYSKPQQSIIYFHRNINEENSNTSKIKNSVPSENEKAYQNTVIYKEDEPSKNSVEFLHNQFKQTKIFEDYRAKLNESRMNSKNIKAKNKKNPPCSKINSTVKFESSPNLDLSNSHNSLKLNSSIVNSNTNNLTNNAIYNTIKFKKEKNKFSIVSENDSVNLVGTELRNIVERKHLKKSFKEKSENKTNLYSENLAANSNKESVAEGESTSIKILTSVNNANNNDKDNLTMRLNSNKIDYLEDDSNENPQREFFIDEKKKVNFFEEIGKYKKESEKTYQLKWYEILFINLCTFTKLYKRKKKLNSLATLKLFKYLDFLQILNHLQEFNRFKKIYFSKKQLDLFNISSKPIISLDKLSKYESDQNKTRIIIGKDGYMDLLNVYRRFHEQSNKDEKIKRLIENIDPKIKLIFDEFLNYN